MAHVTSKDGTTIAYDRQGSGPAARRGRDETTSEPVLVVTGGSSGGLFGPAADAIAARIVDARRLTLPDQGHVADPAALGQALASFFGG